MNPINQIKDLLPSITDQPSSENLDLFFQQLNVLSEDYRSDAAINSFIKMLNSLGSYLKKHPTDAHPQTGTVISELFNQLETLVETPDMPNTEISKTFQFGVSKFKSFKTQITSGTQITLPDLDELRTIILSIDWEITDENLNNLKEQVLMLLNKTKSQTIVHTFLRLIQAAGEYLYVNKSNADADASTFLKSLFSDFESIITTPQMEVAQKKELLNQNIAKYKRLKISLPVQKPVASSEDSEDLPPALSHVSTSSTDDGDTELPLTQLPDESEPLPVSTESDVEEITPALSDTASSSSHSDVMDDLFSVKETPADDLLDAIHLLDVQGDNPDQALKRLDETDPSNTDGITSFTPQRSDNDPIPEIGSRLDEFFNLDESDKTKEASVPRPEQPEPEAPADETGIVPFDSEDESIELMEDPQPTSLPEPDKNLSELKSLLVQPGWKDDSACMGSIHSSLSSLKASLRQDPEKAALIDIIELLMPTPDKPEETNSSEPTPPESSEEQNNTDNNTPSSGGLFGWLKRLFK